MSNAAFNSDNDLDHLFSHLTRPFTDYCRKDKSCTVRPAVQQIALIQSPLISLIEFWWAPPEGTSPLLSQWPFLVTSSHWWSHPAMSDGWFPVTTKSTADGPISWKLRASRTLAGAPLMSSLLFQLFDVTPSGKHIAALDQRHYSPIDWM